jgi:hypothetical protein
MNELEIALVLGGFGCKQTRQLALTYIAASALGCCTCAEAGHTISRWFHDCCFFQSLHPQSLTINCLMRAALERFNLENRIQLVPQTKIIVGLNDCWNYC